MKEIQNIQADQIELHAQKEVEKKMKVLARFKKYPNHKVWELNLLTQEIKEAEYEVDDTVPFVAANANLLLGQVRPMRHRLIERDGCLYEPALNIENARKKFVKKLFTHYQNK
jgi:hypothetical protein